MKLIVEAVDYIRDGEIKYNVGTHIEPAYREEGISTLDKSSQIDRLTRLIDLSEAIKKAIDGFYQERTISSPSSPINTSGEPGTK